jgi:hypothetical protein
LKADRFRVRWGSTARLGARLVEDAQRRTAGVDRVAARAGEEIAIAATIDLHVTITGSMKLRRRSTLTDCCRGAATLTRDKDVAMVETMSAIA